MSAGEGNTARVSGCTKHAGWWADKGHDTCSCLVTQDCFLSQWASPWTGAQWSLNRHTRPVFPASEAPQLPVSQGMAGHSLPWAVAAAMCYTFSHFKLYHLTYFDQEEGIHFTPNKTLLTPSRNIHLTTECKRRIRGVAAWRNLGLLSVAGSIHKKEEFS